jgi:hypothetical protein
MGSNVSVILHGGVTKVEQMDLHAPPLLGTRVPQTACNNPQDRATYLHRAPTRIKLKTNTCALETKPHAI